MARRQDQALIDVIGLLYEGVLDDDAWQQALLRLHSDFAAQALALFSVDSSSGIMHRSEIIGVDRRVLDQYAMHWMAQDPRHAAGLLLPPAQPLTEGTLVPWRTLRKSPVYNEFLRPEGIARFMATWVERTASRGVVLSVQRRETDGAYDEQDRARMAMLIPHLRRIVNIKDRLGQARVNTRAFMEALDRVPFGVLLLDDDLRIEEASALAREILDAGDGIRCGEGRLVFSRAADQAAFLTRLAEDPLAASAQDPIVVRRARAGSPLRLLPVRVLGRSAQWLTPGSQWLVIVVDPVAAARTPRGAIKQLLDITDAEARLVELVVAGASVKQAAERLGISPHTARNQIKSVFGKNGLKGQSDLLRAILATPLRHWLGADHARAVSDAPTR